MKTFLKSVVFLAIFAFFFAPSFVRAQDDDSGGGDDQDVSFQTFYDQLGDQGTWVQTDDYGYVFQPNIQDPDWQPYSDGYWVDSNEGMTWVSDEPWGWATYHYGRWANIEGIGWVWVPGYRWAPAWVSWRYGGGYCGWAPLPPETFYGAEYGDGGIGLGFHFGGDVDISFHIGAGCYNFVRIEDMGERNYRHHIMDRHNNFAIINHTTNVTNININNGERNGGGRNHFHGVTAGGPSINELNAHSRQHIQTVQLAASNQPGRSNLQGNTLSVFAPKVNPDSIHQAKPGVIGESVNHPKFNRGDSITKPFEVTRNVHAPAATPEAIQAAEQAQKQAPATAKIVTAETPIRTEPTAPITSLAPVVHTHTGNGNNQGGQGFNNGNPNAEHHNGNPNGQFHTPGNQQNEVNPAVINQSQQEKPRTEVVNPPPTVTPNSNDRPKHEGNNNGGNPTFTPHSSTFQPSNQNNGQNQQPANTFHREKQENNGEGQPPVHIAPPPPPPVHVESHVENPNNGGFHPQSQNGGQPQGGGNNNHPSGGQPQGGQGGGNHASGGGGGQGNNHPSNGDGKKDDKKPGQ